MRFAAAAFLLSCLTTVFAVTHTVTVGRNGSLLFEPTSVQANIGDVIAFEFHSKNHTVTQSTFDRPCEPKADGIDSGYQFIPADATQFPTWSITVNNETAPIWFFCAQGPHCRNGMVFAVNPNQNRTFDQFLATARASTPPPAQNGGAASPAGGSSVPGASGTPSTITPPQGSAAAGGQAETVPNGALSRAVAGWPVLLGSVALGVLVL